MKLQPITCFVEKVEGIEPLKKGFRQFVILHTPAFETDLGQKIKENFFRVEIYSTQQTDSRFFTTKHLRARIKATLYLNGDRWLASNSQFAYSNKLRIVEWAAA